MGTNYIAPMWRMPRNTNKDKLSNYSINLPLTSDNISMGIVPNLFIGSWSISFWFKTIAPGAGNQNGCMVGRYVSANLNGDLEIRSDNGHIVVATGQNFPNTNTTEANAIKSITSDINDGNWHHCAFSLDYNNGTSTRKLYIDGSLDSSDSSTSPPKWVSNTTQTLFLGQLFNNNAVYNGSINQVSIFDYAIESDQVTYLYGLNNPMVITGGEPVAYWPLGDNSNPNANAGYPNISVGADSVFDFESGDVNFIKAFDVPVTTFTEASFSAWVNFENVAGTYEYIMGMGNVPGNFMSISKSQNSGPFYTYDGTSSNQCAIFPVSNRWYHIVVTQTGTVRRFYIDGVEDANSPFTCPALAIPYDNLTIGAYNNQPPASTPASPLYRLDGRLSNVQVWDTALELSDVETLYNNGQPLMSGTQPQAANLKAWYKLNQSSNWEADTANNWQIPDATSAFPQSFKFISSDTSQINLGDVTYLDGASELTLSAWVKPTAAGTVAADGIFGKDGSTRGFYLATYTGNKFRFFVSTTGSSNDSFNSNASYTIGEWIHLAATWDGSNMKIYINGSEDNTRTTTNATGTLQNNSNPFEIGNLGNYNGPLNAFLSNAQVWTTALPATGSNSIETLYNNGVPLTTAIATDNLKLWYKLNNNELFDGTNWSVENQKYPANWSSALDFSGSNQNINLGNDASLYPGTSDMSYSFWFKSDSLSGYKTIFGQGATDLNALNKGDKAVFITTLGDELRIFVGANIGAWAIDQSNTAFNTNNANFVVNKWYHIVFTFDRDGDGVIYINGVPNVTQAVNGSSTSVDIVDTDNSIIGGIAYDFDGQISNFAIYNTALDSSAVQALYNNGTPETSISSSPISWWKLDNTTTGIQDSIGSNNGTNNGTTKVNTFVSTEVGTSSGMTEQNLVNNNVSVKNGESSGMNTTNIVQSNITRKVPYSNYSFNFDAAQSDYFNCGSNVLFDTTKAFSFSGWVNLDSYSTTYPSIIRISTDQTQDFVIGLSNDSNYAGVNFGAYITFAKGRTVGNISGDFINTWKHVCLIFDGVSTGTLSSYKIYVDGVEVALTSAGSFAGSTGGVNTIGYGGYSNRFFDGKISNISLFDNELTQDDIINLYNNGVPQDLNNFRIAPIAWWPMDQRSSYYDGTDWVVRDLVNGNDGDGANTGNVDDLVGNAPGSEASGTGVNLTIADLKGNMYNSDKNAYSINMADYADGVTNPANSGRSTDTPS